MNGVKKLACGVVLSAALGAASAWATTIDPSNYNYSMTIAPASGQVTSTLTNFPVLVRLSSARQSGFNPADCGDVGAVPYAELRKRLENQNHYFPPSSEGVAT